MIKNIKGWIGILLIAVAIIGIWYWEVYGREALSYENVIVLKTDSERNTYIEQKHLAVMKMEKEKVLPGAIKDPAQILHKETVQFIPAGMMLVEEFFDSPQLVTDEGQYIFSIPNQWLEAYPQSLRRRDTVYVYPVKAEDAILQEFLEEGKTTRQTPEGKALFSATVAYAKNSSNQEVESVDPGRLDGTSSVSLVEIVATAENVRAMQTAVSEGFKFILLYR